MPRTVDPAAVQSPTPSRQSVLLIEDVPFVRDTIAHMLRVFGFQCVMGDDALCALQIAANPNVHLDAVISDVNMPDADGRALVASIRRYRPGLPALLISGYVDGTVEAEASGASFLAKPFSPRELRDALGLILAERGAAA